MAFKAMCWGDVDHVSITEPLHEKSVFHDFAIAGFRESTAGK
jgi:hypothetical protein